MCTHYHVHDQSGTSVASGRHGVLPGMTIGKNRGSWTCNGAGRARQMEKILGGAPLDVPRTPPRVQTSRRGFSWAKTFQPKKEAETKMILQETTATSSASVRIRHSRSASRAKGQHPWSFTTTTCADQAAADRAETRDEKMKTLSWAATRYPASVEIRKLIGSVLE